MKRRFLSPVLVLCLAIFVTNSHAVPILNTLNGHYYDVITTASNWYDANAAAELLTYHGLQGHLATITSSSENSFIQAAFAPLFPNGSAWIGGIQNTSSAFYSEPAGGWEWITGETFLYTNWHPVEPNNIWGDRRNEDGLEFLFLIQGLWNDLPRDEVRPFAIVEYQSVPEGITWIFLMFGIIGWIVAISQGKSVQALR